MNPSHLRHTVLEQQILTAADTAFPHWRVDIQERFVLELGRMVLALQVPPDPHLRGLRLWHWQKLKQCRALQEKHEAAAAKGPFKHSSTGKANDYRRKCVIHLGAVQALNDCFPIGDTAERDDGLGTLPLF